MNKVLAVFLAVAVALCALAGCASTAPVPVSSGTDKNDVSPVSGIPAAAGEADLLDKEWNDIVTQAKEEGQLSLWVWGDEAFWRQIAGEFEKEYGIKVSIMVSDKNTVLNKVLAEKDGKVGTIDVMGLPGDIINTLIQADVLYGQVLSVMPNKALLDPVLSERNEGVKSNNMWVPIWKNYTAMLYNPDKISKDELPQSWDELDAWIEAHPKQFAFCIPEKGGSGQSFMQTVITNTTGGLEQYMSDTEVDAAKTENWDAVWKWINDKKDKITFTTSNADSLTRLNQGEVSMTVAWDSNVSSAIAAGELFKNVGFYMPEFGLVGGGDVQTVLKNAPHPAAGVVWLDFMTSEIGQTAMMKVIGCFPARTDMSMLSTLLSKEDLSKAVEWMPAIYKAYYIDEFTKNVLMN